jgi:hypothetical protein
MIDELLVSSNDETGATECLLMAGNPKILLARVAAQGKMKS